MGSEARSGALISPWIAEHAKFFLTSFEVGRDGQNAYERLIEKNGKDASHDVRGGNLVAEETSRRSTWESHMHVEDGVYLGVKATTSEIILGDRGGV